MQERVFFTMMGNVFLCIVTIILLIVATSAWGNSFYTLEYSAWAKGNIKVPGGVNTTATVVGYFGLSGFTYKINIPTFGGDLTKFVAFKDSDAECTYNFCEICYKTGEAAVSLLICSIFLMFGVLCASVMRAYQPPYDFGLKIGALVLSGISCLFVVIAYAYWNQQCFLNELNNKDIDIFNGLGLAISAWIIILIVIIIHGSTPAALVATSETTASKPVVVNVEKEKEKEPNEFNLA